MTNSNDLPPQQGAPETQPNAPQFPPPPSPQFGQPQFKPYVPPTFPGQPINMGASREYAAWINRVLATIIDGFMAIPFYIPGIVLFGASFAAGKDGVCHQPNGEFSSCREPKVSLLLLGILAFIAGIVVYYVIYCRKLGRTGQTWGRKAMGYKIIDKTTGLPIGAWKAFGRQLLGGFIDGICYLGYLWPLWDKENQKLSDKAMDTIAVKV